MAEEEEAKRREGASSGPSGRVSKPGETRNLFWRQFERLQPEDLRKKIEQCRRCADKVTILRSEAFFKAALRKVITNKKAATLTHFNAWYIKEIWYTRLSVPQLQSFENLFRMFKRSEWSHADVYAEVHGGIDRYASLEEIRNVMECVADHNAVNFFDFCIAMSDTPEYWERLRQDQRYAVGQVQDGYTARQRIFYSAIARWGFRHSLADVLNYYLFVCDPTRHQHFRSFYISHYGDAGYSYKGCVDAQRLLNKNARKMFNSPYTLPLPVIKDKRRYAKKKIQKKFDFKCKCPDIEPHPDLQDSSPERAQKTPHYVSPKYDHEVATSEGKKLKMPFVLPIQYTTPLNLQKLYKFDLLLQPHLSRLDLTRNIEPKGYGRQLPTDQNDVTWDPYFKQNRYASELRPKPKQKSPYTETEDSRKAQEIGPKVVSWHHESNIFKVSQPVLKPYQDVRDFKPKVPKKVTQTLHKTKQKQPTKARCMVDAMNKCYYDQLKESFLQRTKQDWCRVYRRTKFPTQSAFDNFMMAFYAYATLKKTDVFINELWSPEVKRKQNLMRDNSHIRKSLNFRRSFPGAPRKMPSKICGERKRRCCCK